MGFWTSGSKIQLFRFLGIAFLIDPVWLIIFGLMTLSLASQFSKDYPHWTSLHYWAAGLITCFLFFSSIVFHEMAHSLVAKAAGVPVRSITLFILGGLSKLGKEVHKPGVEFAVAVAGPAASIGLSVLFGFLWLLSQARWEMLSALAEWLMQINLLLALFNLIPGFPLDGGRILRSILWGIFDNFAKATRVASAVGRGAASLFFAGAVALALSGQFIYGLWSLFIGWFLWVACRQNERQIRIRESLAGLRAADLMIPNCPRVEAGSTLANVSDKFSATPQPPCLLVLEHGALKGLIQRDHIGLISPDRWLDTAVDEVMTPLERLRRVDPSQDVLKIAETMDREDIQYVPVLDEGRLVGVLGRLEIFQILTNRSQALA
jgi:Zn-dependent protease